MRVCEAFLRSITHTDTFHNVHRLQISRPLSCILLISTTTEERLPKKIKNTCTTHTRQTNKVFDVQQYTRCIWGGVSPAGIPTFGNASFKKWEITSHQYLVYLTIYSLNLGFLLWLNILETFLARWDFNTFSEHKSLLQMDEN